MKFKLRHIVGILLVLTTLLMTTYCVQQNPPKVSGPKNAINTIRDKTKTGVSKVTSRKMLIENNVNDLLTLVLYKGDSIKIAAHRKLVKLYLNANSDDEKRQIVVPLIISSEELVRYYGIVKSRNLKSTYRKGMEYATQCNTLTNNISLCNKWKAKLIQTNYSFLKFGYSTKKQLDEAIRLANNAEENHEMMNFIEAKVACDKNVIWNVVNSIYTKSASNVDCVQTLLPFIGNFLDLGSFEGEFYYLLGKSYDKQNNAEEALKYYHMALNGKVYDKKTSYFNEKAQVQFNKLYLRKNSN